MVSLGDKIKENRLNKGLTQSELAEGICTQASISNLENNTSTPTLMILLTIGKRLNMDFSELSDYANEYDNKNTNIFEQVRLLRSQFKDAEARDLLVKNINKDQLTTAFELKNYYYYLGITSLIGYEKYSDAHYNFDLALSVDTGQQLDFLDILATNGIGLTYFMIEEEEKEKALTYFEKSLTQLDDFMNQSSSLLSFKDNLEIMKLYYTTAKFYSEIGEYKKALNLCDLGIILQKSYHVNYDLERLYYEKGFNLVKLGDLKKARDFYGLAAALAKMDENELVLEIIRENMNKFDLGPCPY
ncbi:helix-turn-helix transcriptional regulator [Carnobacterium sp.]|uniref:helix-turn-helix transcriptional regulator n=1 Tax=Carnobacterium sp. TaxID=48221 RepID=UPI002FC82DE4